MKINNKILIAKNVVNEYISHKYPFTLSELSKAIINQGGVLRLSPLMTLCKYVDYLEDKGIIKYECNEKKYIFFKNN